MDLTAQSIPGFGPITTNPSNPITVNLPLKPSKSVKKRCKNCASNLSARVNHANFNRSHSPARLMQWTNGVWRSLAPEVLSAAKSAFSERKAVVDVVIDCKVYVIDFYRMLLIDISSGYRRSIAWIDVNNDCYFPRTFIDDDDNVNDEEDDDENNLKIKLEIKLDNSNCKRKLVVEEEEVDTAGSTCEESVIGNTKRQRFSDMAVLKGVNSRVLNDVAGVNSRVLNDVADGDVAKEVNSRVLNDVAGGDVAKVVNVRVLNDMVDDEVAKGGKVRILSEKDKSYAVVRELFMTGMRNVDAGVRVSKIHQFVRGVEKGRFWKQMEMVKGARGKANVVFAWLGMSRMGVREVLDCGFGSSRVSGSLGHGVGVHFSPARVSHHSDLLSEVDDNGEKHVLLCRVILGNIEKVASGSQQYHPSSLSFDSGTDDLVNPKWYIVWSKNMNTHVLPEFVVSYKCSEDYQGQQPKASEVMDWIPVGSGSVVTKLFSKLGSCLPASKVDVLRALCMAFKARRIPKDKFLKQLKFVVGEEVLRSVISEILCSN